ncbi:hypothetical protein [Lysobacter sp. P5_B9]
MSQPFSRVYCTPNATQRDSERLRRRIGRYASELDNSHLIVERIEMETGVRVPWHAGRQSLDVFFQKADVRDVLDGITHVFRALTDKANEGSGYVSGSHALRLAANEWKRFVARVLAEEHTTYEIDADCNVRYAVDEAYALNRKATLNGLQDAKWDASRSEFERAFSAMDGDRPDTNGAVRAIAASAEACVKVMIGNGVARIGPPELEKYVWPLIQNAYTGDGVAADASHQILKSLADWINATHQYRHGQGAETEVSVPIELAVQFLTSGSAFIRWLIEVDGRRA